MVSKKLNVLLSVVLASSTFLISSSEVSAAVNNLNGQNGQTQTFQNDSNVTISSSSNVHSLGWSGLLPFSRGGTGVGSLTSGSVVFSNGTTLAQNNSNFFWDNVNNRLGIGTSSPTSTLSVVGNTSMTGNLNVTGTITGNINATNLVPYTGATGNVDLGNYNITANKVTSNTDATINSLTVGRGGGNIDRNTVIGKNALNSTSNAGNNTAVGFVALGTSINSGEQNTAVGSETLSETTTGSYNSALGYRALWQNTTGIRNTAIGNHALDGNFTGSQNVALGFRALPANTTGSSNISVGDQSAYFLTTGGANIVIGSNGAIHQADGSTALTTANNSVYIGNSVQGFNNSDNNAIVIGANAIGAGANTAVIGNSSLGDVYFGSSAGSASTHAKRMYLGTSSLPGCIIMGDTGGGVGYITLDNGALTVSSTPPSACQ